MAFLDETGLAEFKAMTDKAYLEKTITPTSVFRGNYNGSSDGEFYYYQDQFPDQDCIPIITDEDFWETPIGSSRWLVLTEPLNGSCDHSGFAIINDYDTKTDCDSGDKFISYIGDKKMWIHVNHGIEHPWDSENTRYYSYTLQANTPYRITKTSQSQYNLYINPNSSSNSLPSGSEGQFMVYTDGSWQGKTITVGGSY